MPVPLGAGGGRIRRVETTFDAGLPGGRGLDETGPGKDERTDAPPLRIRFPLEGSGHDHPPRNFGHVVVLTPRRS